MVCRIAVDDSRQRRFEPGKVCAPFTCIDVVSERVRGRLEVLGRLHRDLDLNPFRFVFEIDDVLVKWRSGLVEIFDELPDAPFVFEGRCFMLILPGVDERDAYPRIQEGQFAESGFERGEGKGLDLEDVGIRFEPNSGPGL